MQLNLINRISTSMKSILLCAISVTAVSSSLLLTSAHAGMALVIGVADYKESPLINPLNDVNIISSALRGKGWKVTELKNPNSERLKQELHSFFGRDSSGLPMIVYFSGHGLQYKGENYLLPSDANSRSPTILKSALSITELSYFSRNHSGPKIFIVDACRNSPLGRDTISVSAGLNSQFAPPNSMIAYATSPGNFAFDGRPGGNSPYASSLAKAINRADTVEAVFRDTRIETLRQTNGKQVPWESSSLFSSVTFQVLPQRLSNNTAAVAPQNSGSFGSQSMTSPSPVTSVAPTSAQSSNQTAASESSIKPPKKNESGQYSSSVGVQIAENSVQTNEMLVSESVESFAQAYDELARIIRLAPLASFGRWDGKPPTERDRLDFLATVKIHKEELNGKNSRGVVFSLIDAFQRGVMHPLCQKGAGVDRDCAGLDRWLTIQPNLGLSLKLSKLAFEKKISSDRLALHYQNGWGVDKDLLKAYDLYMQDRNFGGEYYWTDINRMVQQELVGLGYSVKPDGDFGPESCKALSSIMGSIKCGATVSRAHLEKLISLKSTVKF